MATGSWSIQHFSQSNPAGEGQADVAALLRRVATSIDDLGTVTVQDIVFHAETDDDGNDWPTMTVYFYTDDAPATRRLHPVPTLTQTSTRKDSNT